MWADFAANGTDQELDEIDRIMRKGNLDNNVLTAPLRGRGYTLHTSQSGDPYALMKAKLGQMIKTTQKGSKSQKKPTTFCAFCKNNGESEVVYNSHQLKDERGRVVCPILFYYKCPQCGAYGENAHTLKYCPKASNSYVDSKAIRATARTAAGIRRN